MSSEGLKLGQRSLSVTGHISSGSPPPVTHGPAGGRAEVCAAFGTWEAEQTLPPCGFGKQGKPVRIPIISRDFNRHVIYGRQR